MQLMKRMQEMRNYIRETQPLIHCITNPISIHDCANVILATGARPIMAEHPKEVEEITAVSSALMLNLGNITDVRMESMRLALAQANRDKIPVILDLVGVTCSHLRRRFAESLLEEGQFAVIKGNISEILAVASLPFHGTGHRCRGGGCGFRGKSEPARRSRKIVGKNVGLCGSCNREKRSRCGL